MTEDILEQLVDGYFSRETATFTKHNVKFRPTDIKLIDPKERNKYSVHSDIDVLAIHLGKQNEERVSVISCKSWQEGFDLDLFFDWLPDSEKQLRKYGSGPIWKKFRELVHPEWAKPLGIRFFLKQTHSISLTILPLLSSCRGKIRTRKHLKIIPFF